MMLRLLRSQIRIVVALAIRDMEAEYARFRLGYLWAFVPPALYVGLLSALHLYIRDFGLRSHDMSPVLFIVFGTLPWLAFAKSTNSLYRVVFANKHMLTLPGVTTLDLVMARGLVEFATFNAVFMVFVAVAVLLDGVWPPQNLLAVIVFFNFSLGLGVGFGMALIPVHRFFPSIEHLMTIVMRFGFWTSGLFFVIDQFPTWSWPYLSWNPMLHVTELIRSAWFTVYESPIGNPGYVLLCLIGFGLAGLLADRLLRRVPV